MKNNGQFKKGHVGYKHWLGKKRPAHDAASKARISATLKGRPKTKKHRENIRRARIGPLNPSWTGERKVTASGHVLLWKPDHPRANSNGRVYEHRLVMEKKLGRPLRRDEHVHHIDCNPANNSIDNLFLTTQGGNTRAHFSMNKLLKGLLDDRIITFNRKNGIYERTTSP